MKILTVVGARPQFIKAAAVSRVLRACDGIEEILVHTGQHYDENMSDVFFDELELPRPDHHLAIGSGSHGAQTGKMLEAIERVLLSEQFDAVLVYGDTNSTLAGALAAVKLHLPVAHVEAGLRSFNRRMPEEINRLVTDQVADLLLAPTETAVNNLHREGIAEEKIHLVGDVMYDASLYYVETARRTSDVLDRLNLKPKAFVLATVHRAENVDDAERLSAIIAGLVELARRTPVILPLHPRTRQAAERAGLTASISAGLKLVEPVGYLDMLVLEQSARAVVTDSGGVQKEAFFFRVPCLTLREETEWTELVELGWNHLVTPAQAGNLAEIVSERVDSSPRREPPAGLYGGGRAAENIRDVLMVSGPPGTQTTPD